MEVSKVVLPADFGIENLDCPVHGNIEIKLKNNQKMRANSMILSLHSPIFQNMFFNLGRTSVDMDDFKPAVVRQFLCALYNGQVNITWENFRELHQIAVDFKIEWLQAKCQHDYSQIVYDILVEYNLRYLVGGEPLAVVLVKLMWILEEVQLASRSTKNSDLLSITVDLFREKISPKGIVKFVEYYLADFPAVSEENLIMAIELVGENHSILLKILRDNLPIVSEVGLNSKCKFLLNNLNLVRCRKQDLHLYQEVFGILLVNFDKSTSDGQMVSQLFDESRKTSLMSSMSNEQTLVPISKTTPDTLFENILNLFHDPIDEICQNLMKRLKIHGRLRVAEKVVGVHAWIDFISGLKELRSMYMVFEALFLLPVHILEAFDETASEKLVALKDRRGFSRVNSQFLSDFDGPDCHHLSTKAYSLLSRSQYLVSTSSHESIRVVSNKWVLVKNFLLKETFHKFDVPHHQHGTTSCSCDPTTCLFTLKVTPATVQCPENFNIQLVTKTSVPNPPCQCPGHVEPLSVDKIHLVAEIHDPKRFKSTTVHLSWAGRPHAVRSEDSSGWFLWWANEHLCSESVSKYYVKLVAYVDQSALKS